MGVQIGPEHARKIAVLVGVPQTLRTERERHEAEVRSLQTEEPRVAAELAEVAKLIERHWA
jgi:actin-like ATPase involved in cell morphogenesis